MSRRTLSSSIFFLTRNAPRIILACLIAILLVTYYRCSPYVCRGRSFFVSETDVANRGYPSAGAKDAASSHQDYFPKNENATALVTATIKSGNTSWMYEYFPEWQKYVYTMDNPRADLTVAGNKGRESMAYLSFIVDHYDDLPAYMIFLHDDRYQWHNEDPMYDGIPILRSLRFPYVEEYGYANLRCTWQRGCPSELHPFKKLSQLEAALEPNNERAMTEAVYSTAYQELLGVSPEDVPSEVAIPAGAQFAVSRWKILERSREEYQHFRDWLWDTRLSDGVSGRVFEYAWHVIFGMPPIHCPSAATCFCQKFNLCNLTCSESACDNRYIMPPGARLPKNWPEEGPGHDGLPDWDWGATGPVKE